MYSIIHTIDNKSKHEFVKVYSWKPNYVYESFHRYTFIITFNVLGLDKCKYNFIQNLLSDQREMGWARSINQACEHLCARRFLRPTVHGIDEQMWGYLTIKGSWVSVTWVSDSNLTEL